MPTTSPFRLIKGVPAARFRSSFIFVSQIAPSLFFKIPVLTNCAAPDDSCLKQIKKTLLPIFLSSSEANETTGKFDRSTFSKTNPASSDLFAILAGNVSEPMATDTAPSSDETHSLRVRTRPSDPTMKPIPRTTAVLPVDETMETKEAAFL